VNDIAKCSYLVFWERVITVCIDCHRIDHDGDLSKSPAHDQGTDTKMLLYGCTNNKEAADIQRQGNVASPGDP